MLISFTSLNQIEQNYQQICVSENELREELSSNFEEVEVVFLSAVAIGGRRSMSNEWVMREYMPR